MSPARQRYLDLEDGDVIELEAGDGMAASVHVIDQDSIDAVNAALAIGRPLLVRGDPGTGKSQLARWGFDWSGAATQVGQLAPGVHAAAPGGVRRDNGCVVLVDEIDKADASVPNGLLDALGNRCFAVPGVGTVRMDPACPPLVVLTTNEERALPDAFLRRCLVLQLALPVERSALVAFLLGRGRAHYPADRCGDAVLLRAAEMVAADRLEMRSREVAAPGLAEYVDLVGVAVAQVTTDAARLELLDRVRKFALRKHPEEPAS